MKIIKSSTELPFQLSDDGKTLEKWKSPTPDVVIPDGVEAIASDAFDSHLSQAVTSLTIPDSVKSILGRPFKFMCNLESVDIPDRFLLPICLEAHRL